jgi:capsular polysaccharide biosynthesis protein
VWEKWARGRGTAVTEDLESRSLELSQYAAVVRRRWYVVVVGVVVGLVGAAALLSVTAKTVTATATVNINVISSAPFDLQKPLSQLYDPTTEQQLASSATVLGGAADELANGKSVQQMRTHTVVQPIAGATIVKISYNAPSKRLAQAGADAIASAYLDYRSTAAAAKVERGVSKLSKQRDSLRKSLLQANTRLDHATPGSPAALQAESDRQLFDLELTDAVTLINNLNSVDTSGGTLITSALDNPVKFNPNSKILIGGGGLIGLIIGVSLAFLVNAFDRRVADGRALTASGGGAILSELASKHAKVPAVGTDLDQIRSLRERLLTSVPSGATLVVMDLVIRDRPSDVAVNLALAMTESGDPVRLVLPDHDARHISLLTGALDLEELESAPDLTILRSRWAPELEVVVTQDEHELGAPGARFVNTLTPDGTQATTLVSMPPTAPRSLWLTAGRLGHSIILVAARRETRVSAVRQLGSELEAVNAVVHGSVLVPRRRTVDMSPVKRLARTTAHRAREESSGDDDGSRADAATGRVGDVPPGTPANEVDDPDHDVDTDDPESQDLQPAPQELSADTPNLPKGDRDADDVRSISSGRS